MRKEQWQMHPYDLVVERIKLDNDVREARQWLRDAGEDYGVIHELSHEESIVAVEDAYNRGAQHVEVIGSIAENHQDSSVDMLLITLPSQPHRREALFRLEETIAGMSGYQLSVDEGQAYVLLRWT